MKKTMDELLTDLSTDAIYLRDFGTDDTALSDLCMTLNAVLERLQETKQIGFIDNWITLLD